MKKTFLTSAVIGLAILGWLMSGYLTQPEIEYAASLEEQNTIASQVEFEAPPTKVRVQHQIATQQTRFAVVRGKTENKRTVDVKAEILSLIHI